MTIFRNDRGNVWTSEGIRLLNEIHSHALGFEAVVDDSIITYEDVCERSASGTCDVSQCSHTDMRAFYLIMRKSSLAACIE